MNRKQENFFILGHKFLALALTGFLLTGMPIHIQFAQAKTYSSWKICKPFVKRFQCVVDGDTFWFQGRKMRLFKVDTPEIKGRCKREKKLAQSATIALRDLLNTGNLEMTFHKTDRFGRRLVEVSNQNGDIGAALIAGGYAVPYGPRDLEKWCR